MKPYFLQHKHKSNLELCLVELNQTPAVFSSVSVTGEVRMSLCLAGENPGASCGHQSVTPSSDGRASSSERLHRCII